MRINYLRSSFSSTEHPIERLTIAAFSTIRSARFLRLALGVSIITLVGCGSSPAVSTGAMGGTSGGAGGVSGATGLPCDVETLVATRCDSCHGAMPSGGAPMSLVTLADLTAPSLADPTMNNAQRAAVRVASASTPMPPAPAAPLTAAEVATLQGWVAAGSPAGSCGAGADPFSVAPTCTSATTWTRGNRGSNLMNPGVACIACHTTMPEAPLLTIAGTVYPTAHEPDLCNGAGSAGLAGAAVVVVGADQRTITLTPNAAGNFLYQGSLALPYQIKVTYMGRERVMTEAQTSGDCNGCHTQSGANNAPGRILLP